MKTYKILAILGCALTMVLPCSTACAQKLNASAVAGVSGNWVICSDMLPRQLAYQVSRQKDDGAWVTVALVKMPASAQEIKATLYDLQKKAGITIKIEDDHLQSVWKRITDPVAKTVPPELVDDLPFRAATGTAWYDGSAEKGVSYHYKVQVMNDSRANQQIITNAVKFPAGKFTTDIRPMSVKPLVNGIMVKFEVLDKGQMTHCKILRSYYLRTGYEDINADPIFIGEGGKTFIQFTDETAAPKVPYTYVVVPLDRAGNEGYPSMQTKVFNVAEKSIAPSVYQFRSYADVEKKAIRLGWQLDNPKEVISIDVYKSDTYDGTYRKIAGVSPTDTSYTDFNVNPVTNYFYTIKLNGRYETSPASPRIPAILKASERNPLPPLDAQLTQNGNQVTISWKRTKLHTHAYFIYRADGDGVPKQIGAPLVTDSVNLSFTDKLPETPGAAVYSYRIADENTSYVISPLSPPLYAYSNGTAGLPIPSRVMARGINEHTIRIVWQDMSKHASGFGGYNIYRRTGNGLPLLLNARIIPSQVNLYTDTTCNNPGTYYYSIKSVGADGKQTSSPSLEAGFTMVENTPAMVTNIKALPTSGMVLLNWNNAVGQPVKSTQIFRAVEGKAPELIATLSPDVNTYADKQVTAGTIYYYTFVTNGEGSLKSPQTDPVGAHVNAANL